MIRFAAVLVLAALSLAPSPTPTGFAVVELFTSEGCSSCPPADDLLIEIARDARRLGQAVYPIAFHVDYWDGQGWKDPYSSRAYTQRQQAYAAQQYGGVPYTPEMIVNGHARFVGSRRDAAQHAIHEALQRPASCAVRASVRKMLASGEVTVAVEVEGARPDDQTLAALVERGIERKIGGGENTGRTLHHGEVVRDLEAAPVGKNGVLTLSLFGPKEREKGKFSVVVFVQDPKSLGIKGASRVDL